MIQNPTATEPTVQRRAFEAWSIEVPVAFAEAFVADDCYWHAYDEHRSISLTSIVISEQREPVSAHRILERAGTLDGAPVDQMPSGLLGRAATCIASQPAIASRLLSGILVTDGRLLLVTITSDDLDWARRVWLSIRSHPAPFQPFTRERKRDAGRRRAH